MPSYELSKKLCSSNVSINLLQEIEKYLLDLGSTWDEEEPSTEYYARIYDKYGEESIDSFQNYYRTSLPNETKRVSLGIRNYRKSNNVKISFSKSLDYTNLEVDIHGDSPREKAYGILNTIENILKEHKNLNFIFYGWHNFMLLPALLGSSSVSAISALMSKEFTPFNMVALFTFLIILVYIALKFTSPYSTLDTVKNRKISAATSWLIKGLAGVFVFGLLATILRKTILGV